MESKKTLWQKIKKVGITLVVIGVGGLAVVSVARMPATVEDVPEREVVPIDVQVTAITAIPSMPDSVELPGTMEPKQIVDVPAEQRGQVSEMLVVEGQEVKEGDVLMRLDAALLEAELNRSKAQASFDSRTLERMRELLERGVLNKSQVEEAEARSILSSTALDVAKTNLERATVYSPISGVLNTLIVDGGEYVQSGDPVARIIDVSSMKVVIQIPERDVPFIRKGAGIKIVVDALGGRAFQGRVTYISELADPGTNTTRIEVTVANESRLLHSGMIVRAQITRRIMSDVIMVPLSSVIPLENGRQVYLVEDGKAVPRKVELGLIRGSEVQVVSGLTPGEQLIVAGHRNVGPGQLVNIVTVDAEGAK